VNLRRLIPVVVLLLAEAGCGRDSRSLRASGIIEMDEIDVASLVGGRITRLTVDEGDSVHAGDTLAVLERGEVAAEFQAQSAQAERAAAQSREVVTGPRAGEVRGARAALASAQAQLDWAQAELARIQTLFTSRVAAQADLDRATTGRDDALARRDAAAERLLLLEAGSRGEQIVAAREAVSAARATALAAHSRLRELVLTAPVTGLVLLRNFEAGEIAQPGQPVVTLGNPDSLWMRVYIAAPEMGRVRRGAPVEVRLTGFKDTYRGRVTEIATRAEFTPRAALTEEERANIVFGVKIALSPTGGVLKAGLPADARIAAGN
jgi:HlyD family secretion protein